MADSGLFDPAALAAIIDRHELGRHDFSGPLWLLLVFEGFLQAMAVAQPVERAAE